MPYSIGTAVVSMGGGWLTSKTGRTKEIMYGSFMISAIGYALLATLNESSNLAKQLLYLFVAALGIGSLFQTPYISMASAVPLQDVATATSTIGLVRSLGGCVGISVSGTIYASEVRRRLSSMQGFDFSAESTMIGDVRGLTKLEPPELREQVLKAYARAINFPWIVSAPLLFVAFILCIFMKHYTLQRAAVTLDTTKKGKDTANATLVDALEGISAKDSKALP